jgi:cell fate regulator YaaT (PSP1 superfamily)
MMGMPMHAQPRSQQLLYFVTFKACRGDVFYVQEGTGLRVRVGDLVIVEADRGTDLGTVIAENITWQRAKELKEQYAKEQYNVLMMYASRRTTAGAPPTASPAGLNGANGPPFANGNSTGAMVHGHAQAQEGQTADLKPKMIKRLAQPHEIQTLRDKEANEAKAKRVCQQKVLEHRLPMEILDAEFQM